MLHAVRRSRTRERVRDVWGPSLKADFLTLGQLILYPYSEGEDSAASFQGPTGLNEHQRVQPMRRTKLARVPFVDRDIEQQLVRPRGSGSSSSSSSSSSSGRSSSSDSGSSSSREDNDSDDDAVHLSGASTVSASNSSSSSGDNPEPQPQPKKYRRVVVHSLGGEVVDVDAMSSDGCPVQMLSEGEYIIHSSS